MSVLFNPKWRRAWSVASAVSMVFFVGIDWLLRVWTGELGLAPRATDLWLSVGLGLALGLIGMIWEGYSLKHRRKFLLTFHQAPLSERLQWKYQGPNLLASGWFLLATLSLIAWCYYAQVFVLPALCAANAVLYMGNRRVAQEFNTELNKGQPNVG